MGRINPVSAAQLRPFQWKKGQSGNPGGRPHLPEELKIIKTLTKDEVARTISKYARVTGQSLEEILKNPALTVLDTAICRIFQQSIEFGDANKLNFLLDRCIGKIQMIVEEEEGEEESQREELRKLSMAELIQFVKKIAPEMEEKINDTTK